MKKIYIIFSILFLFSGSLKAQIQITLTDLGEIGDIVIHSVDTTDLKLDSNLKAEGSNQTWDLSFLSEDLKDTVKYLDPATTPYAADFPSASIASYTSTDYGYAYFAHAADTINTIGVAGDLLGMGNTFVGHLYPPALNMILPTVNGQGFSDSTVLHSLEANPGNLPIPPYDSVKLEREVLLYDSIVGWGNIEFDGHFYACLKQKFIQFRDMKVYGKYNSSGWESTPFHTYIDSSQVLAWWTNGFSGPVVSIEADMQDNIFNISFMDTVLYVGMKEQVHIPHSFVVYPNPAGESITLLVQANTNDRMKATLLDARGRQIDVILPEKMISEGMFSEEIDLSFYKLETGIYFIRLDWKNGYSSMKFIKE